MNRNAESRFAVNPVNIGIPRSRFDRSHSLKTTFNVGELIPIDVQEVLPGDTWSIQTSKVVRLQTLITPIFDNLFMDTYWFFVPNRLVWDHWREFMGENTQSAWIPQVEYSVPQLIAPTSTGFLSNSLADYMGLPINVPSLHVSALPFRAYAKICNDWFVDQNLDDPCVELTDDQNQFGRSDDPATADRTLTNLQVVYGNLPYQVAKYHDYFTSALPGPQKGPNVTVGASANSRLPVVTGSSDYSVVGNDAMHWDSVSGASITGAKQLYFNGDSNTTIAQQSTTTLNGYNVVPSNLYADLSLGNFGIDIADLRTAFQIQKFFERSARGGTRYIEMIKSFFNVTSPDYRLQRSEYLGGNRIPIMVSQVIQQSGTTDTSPQGNVAGISVTTDTHSDFTHSFTEHGYLIGLACVRYKHSYSQGLNRMWSRKTRFQFYWPTFQNIGDEAILNKELYAFGNTDGTEPAVNDEVFGYQERYADYRYAPDVCTGEMRPNAPGTLASWHLGDNYNALPRLSSAWLREDKNNVDRVIAVSSRVSNQLLADLYFKAKVTRPMALFSIPGLVDHF